MVQSYPLELLRFLLLLRLLRCQSFGMHPIRHAAGRVQHPGTLKPDALAVKGLTQNYRPEQFRQRVPGIAVPDHCKFPRDHCHA
jgi:hypothetical protein